MSQTSSNNNSTNRLSSETPPASSAADETPNDVSLALRALFTDEELDAYYRAKSRLIVAKDALVQLQRDVTELNARIVRESSELSTSLDALNGLRNALRQGKAKIKRDQQRVQQFEAEIGNDMRNLNLQLSRFDPENSRSVQKTNRLALIFRQIESKRNTVKDQKLQLLEVRRTFNQGSAFARVGAAEDSVPSMRQRLDEVIASQDPTWQTSSDPREEGHPESASRSRKQSHITKSYIHLERRNERRRGRPGNGETFLYEFPTVLPDDIRKWCARKVSSIQAINQDIENKLGEADDLSRSLTASQSKKNDEGISARNMFGQISQKMDSRDRLQYGIIACEDSIKESLVRRDSLGREHAAKVSAVKRLCAELVSKSNEQQAAAHRTESLQDVLIRFEDVLIEYDTARCPEQAISIAFSQLQYTLDDASAPEHE